MQELRHLQEELQGQVEQERAVAKKYQSQLASKNERIKFLEKSSKANSSDNQTSNSVSSDPPVTIANKRQQA